MTSPDIAASALKNKIGVMLAQIGTPAEPNPLAVRKHLKEFLSDRRVIQQNRLLWWCILHGIILRKRPAVVAEKYREIWADKGSPLRVISEDQVRLLAEKLKQQPGEIEVCCGMRYGEPSLASRIDKLIDKGCSKILLFPLLPQYAGATTASVYDAVFPHLRGRLSVPTLRVVEPFFVDQFYISSLAKRINQSLDTENAKPDRLLLSYHGLPCRMIEAGDPYAWMCCRTTESVLPQLKIDADKVIQCYQSRFGREAWLEPSTKDLVKKLASEGVKDIAVACPGFVTDCLETLHEIGIELKETFIESGGKTLTFIPCLNAESYWIDAMEAIILSEIRGWLPEAGD